METTNCPGCGGAVKSGDIDGAVECPFCGHRREAEGRSTTPFHAGTGAASAEAVGPARDQIGLSTAAEQEEDRQRRIEERRHRPAPPPPQELVSTADEVALETAAEVAEITTAARSDLARAGRRGLVWVIVAVIGAVALLAIGLTAGIALMAVLG